MLSHVCTSPAIRIRLQFEIIGDEMAGVDFT